MRTVCLDVYTHEDLVKSENSEVLQNVVENWSFDIDYSTIYQDAHSSVKAFNDIFETKEGFGSWLDIRTGHIADNILELSGLRLQKYLWNNYKNDLYKGKYYSLWSKTETSYKHYKEGYPVLKSRHSKITLDSSCPLTGHCYDHSILNPIIDYMDAKKPCNGTTFEDLLNDCLHSLSKDIESEKEYMQSSEYVLEQIEANRYEFFESGEMV